MAIADVIALEGRDPLEDLTVLWRHVWIRLRAAQNPATPVFFPVPPPHRISIHIVRVSLVVSIGIAGCSLLDPSGPPSLTTDRSSYTAVYISREESYRQYGFTVITRFVNRTSGVLYLTRCSPNSPYPTFGVQLLDGPDPWGSAYDGAWACAGHDRHIEVGPGEVRTDTLPIRGPNSFSGITGEPFGSLDGRMRLMFQVSAPPGDGARPVPPVYGISNTFTVVHVP